MRENKVRVFTETRKECGAAPPGSRGSPARGGTLSGAAGGLLLGRPSGASEREAQASLRGAEGCCGLPHLGPLVLGPRLSGGDGRVHHKGSLGGWREPFLQEGQFGRQGAPVHDQQPLCAGPRPGALPAPRCRVRPPAGSRSHVLGLSQARREKRADGIQITAHLLKY